MDIKEVKKTIEFKTYFFADNKFCILVLDYLLSPTPKFRIVSIYF